jgi:immune inhibitor A
VTGALLSADDVFADWVITSYLNDPDIEDGRYAYRRYAQAPQPGDTEQITRCSSDWQTRDVKQYGVDYIRIDCTGDYTLRLEGSNDVRVFPVDPYSGEYAFWSNKGDESDMILTRAFDFSQVSGPLTLTYHTWYNLEKDYDYLFLVASEDGENWQILRTPSGTDEDPSGNSYGWGYNGTSGGWIEESVDLSEFAGKQIQLRFEYITDMAVNNDGFVLDDVRIPEIDYSEDFETGEGGWEGDGFVRIQNRLPQTYRIAVIRDGRTTSVEKVALEAGQAASIPLHLGGEVRDTILVISGTTRFITQPASYRFRFD